MKHPTCNSHRPLNGFEIAPVGALCPLCGGITDEHASAKPLSQNDRVLAALRQGPITAADFAGPNVCDGLKPILRLAARIGVLRDRGCVIRSEPLPGSPLCLYRLVSEPQAPKIPQAAAPTMAGRVDDTTHGSGCPESSATGLFDPDLYRRAA